VTRATLVATARRLFAERGYGAVGTEEIVRESGVTRGALYHHFADKQRLFRAVVEQVERELADKVGAAALEATDPLDALRRGAAVFLDSALDPEVQQITLLDGPSVLGWEAWREIGEAYGLGLVQATLQAAMDAGLLQPQPVRPLAHLLIGALDEAALYLARADDLKTARAEVGETVESLLRGLAA